jgi:hypothetical protein
VIRGSGRFAALWVYIWGLFAVAVVQRLLFAPEGRSPLANLAIFAAGATIVIVGLTVLERVTKR